MPMVHPNAAAIDVGATMHTAAVRADWTPEPVRSFGTFTTDLHRLVNWFKECGVETVVMESTSVYWIPIFELLDARGFSVFLVNARDAKHVPGRKTDVSDAQWLQRLHSYGLLRASFRPKGQIAELRAYVRQRERLLEYGASHIQHMQKALTEMNLQLHHVVADITGATGLRIIRAILAGERDPKVLARLRHYQCHASADTIEKALTGSYRSEHLFALEQALALYDVYQEKAAACDIRIEAVLKELSIGRGPRSDPLPSPRRHRATQANGLAFDVRAALFALLGKDLTQINGLGPYLSLKLIAECGDDLSAWPSAKHFTSWLGLAPSNKISGGKGLSPRTPGCGNGPWPPRRARLQSFSTTPCVTGWSTSTPARPSTRPVTARGWSTICIGAPRHSALFSSPSNRHPPASFLRNSDILYLGSNPTSFAELKKDIPRYRRYRTLFTLMSFAMQELYLAMDLKREKKWAHMTRVFISPFRNYILSPEDYGPYNQQALTPSFLAFLMDTAQNFEHSAARTSVAQYLKDETRLTESKAD